VYMHADIAAGAAGSGTLAGEAVRDIDRGLAAVAVGDGLFSAAILRHRDVPAVDVHLYVGRITVGALAGEGTGCGMRRGTDRSGSV